MGWHWWFSALALAGGACLAVYAFYVWRRRRASAGASLAVMLAAAGWWGLAYALELAATGLPARLLWGDAKWLGICLLPPAWFAFIMRYTGRDLWVNRATMAALAGPPAAVIVLLANPATHDLAAGDQRLGLPQLRLSHGCGPAGVVGYLSGSSPGPT